MLVMDENRNFNFTPEYLAQLRTMLKRDRNHPSVILWSVFNEEPIQATEQGRDMVARMRAEVRKWDLTRPVTAAMNGGVAAEHGVFEAVDVMGFNYQQDMYDLFHQKHPELPIISSEDTCGTMTRSEFANDSQGNVLSSYDTEISPWGNTHRRSWKLIAERPFVAGGFVWTGFDYRGEPQPLAWPSVSAVFGILDVCGFPKTASFIRQSDWVKDRPVLALAPHWNWQGMEGRPIKVIAMTNAEKVALWLNGKPLGEKARPAYDYVEWQVPYSAGKLEAVAYRAGQEVARTVVETTGPVAALKLVPDREFLAGDGDDVVPITIQGVDAQGRVVPEADNLVEISVDGPGENIGHGNGNHNSHESEKGPKRRMFHGLAQVLVQSKTGGQGTITVCAQSEGLGSAQARLLARPASVQRLAAPEPSFSLREWQMSPPSASRPDPSPTIRDGDMNSWSRISVAQRQEVQRGHWVLLLNSFKPWAKIQERGGEVLLSGIPGCATAYLDGVEVAKKETESAGELRFSLPASPEQRTICLLIHCQKGAAAIGSAKINSK